MQRGDLLLIERLGLLLLGICWETEALGDALELGERFCALVAQTLCGDLGARDRLPLGAQRGLLERPRLAPRSQILTSQR